MSTPSNERTEHQRTGPALERRGFIALTLGWAALMATFASSTLAAVRFLIPNVLYEPSRRFRLGRPAEYPEGSTFIEDVRVFILRRGNSFRAISAVCTHLGCTVNRVPEDGYFCPCHGSRFDNAGAVTAGPAPRALSWHQMAMTKDGRLLVDVSREGTPDKYLVV